MHKNGQILGLTFNVLLGIKPFASPLHWPSSKNDEKRMKKKENKRKKRKEKKIKEEKGESICVGNLEGKKGLTYTLGFPCYHIKSLGRLAPNIFLIGSSEKREKDSSVQILSRNFRFFKFFGKPQKVGTPKAKTLIYSKHALWCCCFEVWPM